MALFSGEGGSLPLMGGSISAALRRKLVQFSGLVYAGLGGLLVLALLSYAATDPSYFVATAKPAANLLGAPGAFIADALMRGLGLGAYGLVVLLLVWGWRLTLKRNDSLIWPRLPAIPLSVVLASIFASTHVPWSGWELSVGLGGWLGDFGVGTLIKTLPMAADPALRTLSLCLGLALMAATAFALGATAQEIASLLEWLWRSARAMLRLTLRLMLWALVRLYRMGVAGLAQMRRPRSERLGPAEPTGSWRNKVPGLNQAAAAAERVAELAAKVPPGLPENLRGAFAEDSGPDLKSLGIDPDISPDHAASIASIRVEPSFGDTGERKSGIAGAESALSAAMRALSGDGPGTSDEQWEATPAASKPSVSREKTAARLSKRAARERQPGLFENQAKGGYSHPPLTLLQKPVAVERGQMSDSALEENARMLETVLEDYGVRGEIVAVKPGPVVTLYELEPAPGLKASRVIGLADDIARSMSALSARVSTMPGRSVIGIELPNNVRETVYLRETLESPSYGDSQHRLALALGKDIQGRQIVANLAKMPHLLIAGTTGSGKSVAINTMILSLLYRLSPEECRLIMIDPKMLELSVYDNIPHLLAPVVTDPKKALVALKWVVAEMEERYRKMSKMGVRNIDGYNARVREALKKGEEFSRVVQTGFDDTTGEPVYETETFAPEEMPFIVVIVDEMADLMMVAGKEIEACIQRLAQMARASGIHLIMATQRPSVDVITGTIKANFPTRISFQVTSKIDSRTILGEQGAEQLLGQGDMLYMAGGGRITRVHGPFVTDEEVEEVVAHLKTLGVPDYVSAVTDGGDEETQALVDEKLGLAQPGDSADELYDRAVAIVARDRKCSTSYIQRKLAIGYNKAARLVEQMEEQGVVSSANAVGKREILVEER